MRGLWLVAVAGVVVGCSSNSIELDSGDGMGTSAGSDEGTTTGSGPITTAGPQPTTAGPATTMTTSATTADTGFDTGIATGFDTGFDTGFVTGDSGPFTSDSGFPGEVSFFADVAPILQSKCAPGCHEPGGEWALQDLLNSPYFALVDVPSNQVALDKVEPGSLDLSYMWHKLNGTHDQVGGVGLAMPKNEDPLDDFELQIIATWILDGAPNN